MATRGRQKKPNATKSMKELTKLEKEAEARSEKRRANIARNKAAGNAGLSSRRLNRMEAEAERKSAERRAASTKPATPSTMKVDPSERIAKPDTKGPSVGSRIASAAKKAAPAARAATRFAGPVGIISALVAGANALPDSVKKSGLTGGGQMDRGKKKRTSSATATQQSNKTPSTPSTPKAPSTSTSQGEPRSIAEAKKMGKDYFVGKDGKRKAAVTAEELKASGMSLRDYLNKQQGKTRKSD
jgi:hypothetical protein